MYLQIEVPTSIMTVCNKTLLLKCTQFMVIYRTSRSKEKVYFKFYKVHSQPANSASDHKECFIAPQRVLYSFNKALFAVQ